MKTNQSHPNADWSWWKITGAGLIGFGLFGFIIAFMPPRSMIMQVLGITSIVFAVVIGIWNWKVYSCASRITLGALWSAQMLTIGIISWTQVYPPLWVYPMVIAYIFAWTLPAFDPSFSKFLWREQTAPQTRLGRILLGLALSLAPIAGAVGAGVGMFGSRFDGTSRIYLISGPLFLVVAIGMAFSFAYQILPDCPWANLNKGIS